jgi:hypothetical protein
MAVRKRGESQFQNQLFDPGPPTQGGQGPATTSGSYWNMRWNVQRQPQRGAVGFPFQLSMFEQAGTLDKKFAHNDATTDFSGKVIPGGATSEKEISRVRERKLIEAHMDGSSVTPHVTKEREQARWAGKPSMAQSIQAEGVRKPVDLALNPDGKTVFDGHHRMYTAADVNPSMEVPVAWHDLRGHPDVSSGVEAKDLREQMKIHPGLNEAWYAVRQRKAQGLLPESDPDGFGPPGTSEDFWETLARLPPPSE